MAHRRHACSTAEPNYSLKLLLAPASLPAPPAPAECGGGHAAAPNLTLSLPFWNHRSELAVRRSALHSRRLWWPLREAFMILLRLARWIGLTFLAVTVMVLGGWSALAIWFRFDATEPIRDLLAGIVVLLTVVAAVCVATSRRWIAVAAYATYFAAMLVWWSTVTPSNDRDWQPDVARSVTATIDGDRLVVSNVRNFNWRSDTDFDQRWEERTYSLSHVSNVDLILSYWAGEAITHLIVSIGFDDGTRLAFSIETRKPRGEEYSTIAGFFRQYELSIIAADERDVVRVRSNVRGEDVQFIASECRPCMPRRCCGNTWRRPTTRRAHRAGTAR